MTEAAPNDDPTAPPTSQQSRAPENDFDGISGRISSLDRSDTTIADQMQHHASTGLGDGCRVNGNDASDGLARDLFDAFTRITQMHASDCMQLGGIEVHPSPDHAIESAIWTARCRAEDDHFKVISLVGSDHGRTTLARTLSGRPELHQGFGPLVPGVQYCQANDIGAFQDALDDSTAAVLISPCDLNDGCRLLDEAYLVELSDLCRRQNVPLIVDESRLSFASTCRPFAMQSIAEVPVDAVVLSAGLFGGLAGGLLLSRDEFFAAGANLFQGNDSESSFPDETSTRFSPGTLLHASIAAATVARLNGLDVWANVDACNQFAADLAHAIGGFEFVRDMNVLGATIGIETDIPADEIVQAVAIQGLQIEAAGETSVRLQLPVVVTAGIGNPTTSRDQIVDWMRTSLETIERQTVDLG